MKHLTITFFAVTAFAVGCKAAAEESGDDTQSVAAEQFDQITEDITDATHEIATPLGERKDRVLTKERLQRVVRVR